MPKYNSGMLTPILYKNKGACTISLINSTLTGSTKINNPIGKNIKGCKSNIEIMLFPFILESLSPKAGEMHWSPIA